MAPPKAGRRGDLALPLLERERPFRAEHDLSVAQPRPPQTWESCVSWFRDAWEASLPVRIHTRGVEDGGDAGGLGSPKMAGGMHQRIDHVSRLGWGVTGWDKDGRPRGMAEDGTVTRDPFLFYLELRLRSRDEKVSSGAQALVWWAYLAWDTVSAAFAYTTRLRAAGMMPEPDARGRWAALAFESVLERTIRQLWHDCQREPVRYSICPSCRRRGCVCGQRSEAQIRAEGAEETAG